MVIADLPANRKLFVAVLLAWRGLTDDRRRAGWFGRIPVIPRRFGGAVFNDLQNTADFP
jgi:hypothetical protein